MKSRFGLILVAIVAIFGIILVTNKKDAGAPVDENGNVISVEATNHVKGDGDKLTLTEYGDFQCPACGAYYPIVEQVVEKYKADITFQFRNFPLTQIHPHAMLASRSAEAAGNQGKFWEMYQQLYEGQTTWSSATDAEAIFRTYAEGLGLDMTKYDADVKSATTNAIINKDISEGKSQGVNSTPTFFIDGKKIENPKDAADFEKVIQDALSAKQ